MTETAAPQTTKRLRLLRSILLNKEHAERGSEHEVPNALAQRLVGEGSAEHMDAQDAPTTVNRMQPTTSRDPESKPIAPAKPKGLPDKK